MTSCSCVFDVLYWHNHTFPWCKLNNKSCIVIHSFRGGGSRFTTRVLSVSCWGLLGVLKMISLGNNQCGENEVSFDHLICPASSTETLQTVLVWSHLIPNLKCIQTKHFWIDTETLIGLDWIHLLTPSFVKFMAAHQPAESPLQREPPSQPSFLAYYLTKTSLGCCASLAPGHELATVLSKQQLLASLEPRTNCIMGWGRS